MNRLRKLLKSTPLTIPYLRDWFAGMSVATLFILLFSRLRISLGASSELMIAALFSAFLGVMVCAAFLKKPGKSLTALSYWALACWALLQPAVLKLAMDSVGQFTLKQLESPTTQFGVLFIIVLTSLLPFAFTVSVIASQSRLKRSLFVGGIAGSFFVVPILLGIAMSPMIVQWIAIVFVAAIGIQALLKPEADALDQQSAELKNRTFPMLKKMFFAVCIGASFAVASFVSRQLMLSNLVSEYAVLGGLVAGIAIASGFSIRLRHSQKWLMLAIWSVCIAMLYPTLTYLALSETVWISNTLLLFATRSLLLGCLTLPLGVFLAAKQEQELTYSANFLILLFSFACGFACSIWSGLSVSVALICLIAISVCASVTWVILKREYPRTRIQTVRLATSLGLIVFGCATLGRLDVSRSEKVLFTGNTYAAFRSGVDWSLLPWIDDGRIVEEHSNLNTRWSLWKQRGQQTSVRENGLVTEVKSDKITACPLSASEVLPGLFPLVAHPAAEHVLVLGVHGTTLHTCEAFPLRSITVIEDSDFFPQMKSWVTSNLADASNIEFVNADLQLGVKARHSHPYDVIIAPLSMAATTEGVAQMTTEFYQAISSQLTESGIFCQRLAFYDLGPGSVRSLAKTLKGVFPQVLVVESVPGELLLIGTQQSEPLITRELVGRLQSPQTRRTLSAIGWDWSIPASRGTLDDETVQKWTSRVEVALSVRNLDSVFKLPTEIARWETNSLQTRHELAKHGMALGAYLGEGSESLDIQQRLEDLELAQKILNNSPDDVWSYRAALKKQLTERPRAKIMQVKHEGLKRRLHPDDQRRKDYLEALGELTLSDSPTMEMVDHLIQYMQPFDPLLGPFVSNETIHQLKRVDGATESAQYFNLLYSIYFSTAADKSVRNVCMATNLLCEHPEIVSQDADRWDQLNGLVEIFRHRWQMRFHDQRNQSGYETIDTERSLAAIKLAVKEMEQLASEAGLSEADWNARKEIIKESLERPLRLHRSQQLRRRKVKSSVQ